MNATSHGGRPDDRLSEMMRRSETPLANDPRAVELFTVVAEELRTPLAVARGYASTLVRELAAQTAAESRQAGREPAIAESARQVERSLELITLMLDRLRDSWTPDGGLQLHLEPADLAELVAETITDVGMTLAADHPIDVRNPIGNVPIAVDVPRIRQILFNLLSNAASYSGPGVPILVTTTVDEQWVVVDIRNHGTGVASGEVDVMFDKFARVDDTAGAGLGIGLWLSREIARAHGGELRGEPDDLIGSRFVLELPRHPADHLREG